MIRVQAPVVFIVFVLILLGGALFVVQTDMQDALNEDSHAALRTAAVAAEQSARLDEAALLAKAQLVASSGPLYDSLTEEPPAPDVLEGEEAPERDIEGERHLVVHEKLDIGRIVLNDIAMSDAARRNIERGPLSREPVRHEVFMVLDADGIGVAALGKDLYSWFGDDVGKEFPIIDEVLAAKGIDQVNKAARIDYWMWSFNPTDEKKLYRVAVVPVRPSLSDEPAGVVVLGNSINDGLAGAKRDLFAGNASGEALEGAAEVAFIGGGDVVGSSLSSDAQAELVEALGKLEGPTDAEEGILDVSIGETNYSAIRRHIGESSQGKVFQVLVLLDQSSIVRPVENTRVTLLFLGVLVLLFGTTLLTFLLVRWMRPIEDIETGLQETLAGNRDYVWEPKSGHSIQESLAQGLNLVSAFLQGKPMPDDDSTGGNWGDFMSDMNAQSGGSGGGAKPKVGGVAIPGMAPPPKADDDENGEA